MKSFSLKNAKWLIAPLITVAIIGLMWCYYMVVYLPNRVEYLSGRNLRVLAMIGNEITSATENYNQVLRLKWQPSSSTRGEGKEHTEATQKYTIGHTFEREESGAHLVLTYVPENLSNASKPESHRFPVGLTPREFDIVLVVNESGHILFHQAPTGIQISSLDHLARAAGIESENDKDIDEKNVKVVSIQKENTIPTVTEIRDVVVKGQPYKLFLLPVEVPVRLVGKSPNGIKEKERWAIAGLVKTSRFKSESRSISYMLRSVVLSLMIVMLVSLPLMRMLTLSKRERVQPLNIVTLAFSLLMGTALVVLMLADTFVYSSAESRLNRQTNHLADEIAQNVREEIQHAYKQLHSMTPEAIEAIKEWQRRSQQSGHRTPRIIQEGDILKTRVSAADPYPFLGEVFWINPEGNLSVNWSIGEKDATKFMNLQEREYFQHARDNRLWTIPLGSKDGPQDARLWVQPIYSWDTGKNTAVLAMPLSDAVPEAAKNEFEHWVAALETKFLSLIDPVMPQGFSFAVIDEHGLVLFHSNQKRNLRESFIEETDHGPIIQAALAGRMNKEGDGVYWGEDQHFVVKPLEGLPWTLVVFRDKQLLHTAAVQGLGTATILLLLYAALLLGVLWTAGWLLCKLGKPSSSHRSRATWLWPNRDKQLAYRSIIVFNLGMAFVLAWFILWEHEWKTVAAGAGIPFLAVGFAFIQWTRRRQSTSPMLNARRNLYQLTAASFVLVLSVLPAAAFFKTAYEVEDKIFLMEGQLSLATGLAERERRIREYYKDVTFSSSKDKDKETHKEKFVQRRLNTDSRKDTLDVYSQFFAETQTESVDTEFVDEVRKSRAESFWNEQQFLHLIEAIRIPFNDRAAKSTGMLHNVSSDGTRIWVEASDTDLVLYYTPPKELSPAKPVIKISSQTHTLLETPIVFLAVIAIALLGWSVCFVIGRIGETIFGSGLSPASEYQAAQGTLGDPIGNALVLGPTVPNQMRLGSYHCIDFDNVMADYAWVDTVRADLAQGRGIAIALLNWDCQIESPSRNQQRLELLLELLTEGRTVLIQSKIDPTHFDLDGDIDADSEQIWDHALRSFSRWYPEEDGGDVEKFEQTLGDRQEWVLQNLIVYSQEKTMQAQTAIKEASQVIWEECHPTLALQKIGSDIAGRLDLSRMTSSTEVLETLRRVTDRYYRQLWATCSWGERYVLFALSRDGFVCCTQPEVQQLLQRGLIEREPVLGPFNATFREWILQVGRDPIYAQAWEKSESEHTWITARHITIALLAALGLFLYATQQEKVGHLMEFGTALLVGIPIIGEWLGKLAGENTSTAEKT